MTELPLFTLLVVLSKILISVSTTSGRLTRSLPDSEMTDEDNKVTLMKKRYNSMCNIRLTRRVRYLTAHLTHITSSTNAACPSQTKRVSLIRQQDEDEIP